MSMVIPLFPKRRGMEQKMIRSIPLSLKGRGMEQKTIRTFPPSPKERGMGTKDNHGRIRLPVPGGNPQSDPAIYIAIYMTMLFVEGCLS